MHLQKSRKRLLGNFDKQDEDLQKNRNKHYFIVALLFVSIAVEITLFLNSLFHSFEKWGWCVVSPLDYKDALLMFISVVATISIAFFEYRVQIQIEDGNALQEIKRQGWHNEELISELLKSMDSLCQLGGYAINYYIPEAYIFFSERNESAYHIVIGGNNIVDKDCFYHPYFEVDHKVYYHDGKDRRVQIRDSKLISPSCLILDLDESDNIAQNFFLSPCALNSQFIKQNKLKLTIELTVKDLSFASLESFSYQISFYISPAHSYGYDANGKFMVAIEDVHLSKTTTEN